MINSQINLKTIIFRFMAITIPTDVQAPLGTRPSTGTEMMKFMSYTFMILAIEGLTHCGL